MPAYFSPDFIKFLTQLEKNNNREWFNKNKERFEENLKKPFEAFVSELILRVSGKDPEVKIEPREAIFRIYRDVRFSKDKTPYKTHMSAVIGPGGKKHQPGIFGMYVQLSPHGIAIYGGVHQVGTTERERIKKYIISHTSDLKKILNNKTFKAKYKEIIGTKYKRLPKEFQKAAKKQPLLWNKEFYIKGYLSIKKITDPKLTAEIMKYYDAARPLNNFFAAAIKTRS